MPRKPLGWHLGGFLIEYLNYLRWFFMQNAPLDDRDPYPISLSLSLPLRRFISGTSNQNLLLVRVLTFGSPLSIPWQTRATPSLLWIKFQFIDPSAFCLHLRTTLLDTFWIFAWGKDSPQTQRERSTHKISTADKSFSRKYLVCNIVFILYRILTPKMTTA